MNKLAILHVCVFGLGWLLYVLGQAQNSVKSSTNGLVGKSGWSEWLRLHAVNLATRAFFSALAYTFIVNSLSTKLEGMGFALGATTIAGVGGYSANAALYQFFGLFPGMRVEVADLAPPMNPPSNPKGDPQP